MFLILLDLVGPEISKQDTNYRRSIKAEERLALFSLTFIIKSSTSIVSGC